MKITKISDEHKNIFFSSFEEKRTSYLNEYIMKKVKVEHNNIKYKDLKALIFLYVNFTNNSYSCNYNDVISYCSNYSSFKYLISKNLLYTNIFQLLREFL